MEFDLYPVGEVYAGGLFCPCERAREVLHAWREWSRGVPDEVTSSAACCRSRRCPRCRSSCAASRSWSSRPRISAARPTARGCCSRCATLGPAMDTFAMRPAGRARGAAHGPAEPGPGRERHAPARRPAGEALDALVAVAGPGSGSPLVSRGAAPPRRRARPHGPHHGALATLPGEFAMFGVGVATTPEVEAVVQAHAKRRGRGARPTRPASTRTSPRRAAAPGGSSAGGARIGCARSRASTTREPLPREPSHPAGRAATLAGLRGLPRRGGGVSGGVGKSLRRRGLSATPRRRSASAVGSTRIVPAVTTTPSRR